MEPAAALLHLAGNQANTPITFEMHRRVELTREAVQRRSDGVDQTDLVQELPQELEPYALALNAGVGRQFFDEGWRLGLVDLSRVCAAQPVVFIDGPEMIDTNNPPSVAALANITLPLTSQHEFNVQPDQTRALWSITSMNPNLRVFGNIAGPPTPGQAPWFGFAVAATPSMMQVVRNRGRYILRDGYHRAVSLLAHGITIVPAFIWDDSVVEQVLPPGMLPQNAYWGPRPPVLLDYLDDEVADTVNLPAMRKVIVVQATEFLLGS
jgi:hypothetical protein